MAMHNTNSLLKYVVPVVIVAIVIVWIASFFHHASNGDALKMTQAELPVKNTAAHDSAAESLDTLTAELAETKQKVSDVSKNDAVLKKQNSTLLSALNTKQSEETSALVNEVQQLKSQVQAFAQNKSSDYTVNTPATVDVITTVPDLSQQIDDKHYRLLNSPYNTNTTSSRDEKVKPIPYYTIPANGTSVKDHLMTALVGRIPIKGIVTDPYPFKIIVSDDNLAANGLRIPHLLQMIVSGYCEGDLNLVSVRGWVTSLTFVFDDGTISTTTSNDNNIGHFTKSNSLGYLSDQYGNPFIRGKLITNAPAYLGGSVAIDAGVGAANAYAASQTTNSNTLIGTTNSAVTGSAGKYVAGEALSNAANGVQQWWHDREQQSFDAIYVAPTDTHGRYVGIAVNFAKEIQIDYNPQGRKLSYAHDYDSHVHHDLD